MNILMPQLGETVAEGKITKWFKSAGDAVKPGDNLFEIETDKTSMEVPATSAGTLSQILFQVGETAKVGSVVAVLADGASIDAPGARETSTSPVATPLSPVVPAKAGTQNQQAPTSNSIAPAKPILMDPFREVRTPERNFGPARLLGGATVTPLARRLAVENGIDLSRVKGSGPHGRVVASDIEQKIADHRRPAQTLGPNSADILALYRDARFEEVPLDAARKAAAERLVLAQQTVPHLVLTADIEVGGLSKIRDEANAARPDSPIAIRDFAIKAWALALQRVSAANAVFAQDRILQFEQSDIAVAIEGGAIALIRNAEQKTVGVIASEARAFAQQAIEIQGGSTTVVLVDAAGIRDVSVLLNPPQATLLAIGAIRRQPVDAPDNSWRFESVVTATLCCDARVVDAALGAQLLNAFKGFIERPVTMLV